MAELLAAGKRKMSLKTRISSILRESGLTWSRDSPLILLMAAGEIAVLSLVFYRSLPAFLLLSPLMLPLYRRGMRRAGERRSHELSVEFGEMMNSVLTGLKAGYSSENAFRQAYDEMVFLYGKDAPVSTALKEISAGLDNHVPIERLLWSFASDSGIEEIQEFAEVFSIARKSGGNMAEVMNRTILTLQNRMDVESEIQVMISSRKLEQNIMEAVPFVIVLYISITAPGFFDVLYEGLMGRAIMSACLAVYLAAYAIGEKIMEIRV